jgi:hypothetical protein
MQRVKNPELRRRILRYLADKYKLLTVREGIHLSTLVYCLTRSFLDQATATEPTDSEIMLFSLGLGLQDVLTPPDAITPVYEKDGIIYSPDFRLVLDGITCELKTTRASSNKYIEAFPETWIEYIKGGCHILGIHEYELATFYMLGNYKPPFPDIDPETLIFESEELEENWIYLLGRRDVYLAALEGNKPPKPKQYCKDWECEHCRYKTTCDAILFHWEGIA